jgi:hypothetical protein
MVATVTVAVAPLEPGVTLVGETLQVLAAGAPEQASDTAFVNDPLTLVMVSG